MRKVETLDTSTVVKSREFLIKHVAADEAYFYICIRPPQPPAVYYSADETSVMKLHTEIAHALDTKHLQTGTRTVFYCARFSASYRSSIGATATVPVKVISIMDVLEVNGQSVREKPLMERLSILKDTARILPHPSNPLTVQMAQYRSSKTLPDMIAQNTPRADFRPHADALFHSIKGYFGEEWVVKTQGCLFVFKNEPFSTPTLFWDSIDSPNIPVAEIMSMTAKQRPPPAQQSRDPRKTPYPSSPVRSPPPPPPRLPPNAQDAAHAIMELLRDVMPVVHAVLTPVPLDED